MSTDTYDPASAAGPPVRDGDRRLGQSNIHRRISWSAIFGGVVIIVALQVLLSVLGAAIGLGTVHVNSGETPDAETLGRGAAIWWVVSSCFALAIGGYISAWLAGVEIRFDGMLHGLAAWSIATLLTVALLTSAVGGIIGGGFAVLGGLTSGMASGVGGVAKPIAAAAGYSPDLLVQQARSFLQDPSANPAGMSADDAQKAVVSDLATYMGGGPDAAAAKDRIVAIMAAQMKISPDQASQRFDETEAKVRQARDQAIQSAKNAADAGAADASRSSYAAFGMLLLGLLSAAIGGSFAVQHRLHVVSPASGWKGTYTGSAQPRGR